MTSVFESNMSNQISQYESTKTDKLCNKKIPNISRSSFAVQAACAGPRRPTKKTFLYINQQLQHKNFFYHPNTHKSSQTKVFK
jgi:hypothetical protein